MPLEGTPPILPPTTQIDCDQQNFIEPPITVADGCEVLPKMQCHEIQKGQDARLMWTYRSSGGEPVNLDDCVGACSNSESLSESGASDVPFDAAGNPPCGATLRLREITMLDRRDQIHTVDVDVIDSGTGYVAAQSLPEEITRHPGVYATEWAVMTEDKRMLFSNPSCLFVNRGLFGMTDSPNDRLLGPPSIQDIRLSLRDNSQEDNTLLDNVEFDGAEIAQAVVRPIRMWNEMPPPLRPLQTTKTFPLQELWLLGIQSFLLETAAHNYRRNDLPYSAGGVSVQDKAKADSYDSAAHRVGIRFRELLQAKKIEINIQLFSGVVSSPYGGLFH